MKSRFGHLLHSLLTPNNFDFHQRVLGRRWKQTLAICVSMLLSRPRRHWRNESQQSDFCLSRTANNVWFKNWNLICVHIIRGFRFSRDSWKRGQKPITEAEDALENGLHFQAKIHRFCSSIGKLTSITNLPFHSVCEQGPSWKWRWFNTRCRA